MMLTLAKNGLKNLMDFFKHLSYTKVDIGGIVVNEFEKDVQSKNNDVVDSGLGFVYSFIFFTVIFFVGVAVNFFGQ